MFVWKTALQLGPRWWQHTNPDSAPCTTNYQRAARQWLRQWGIHNKKWLTAQFSFVIVENVGKQLSCRLKRHRNVRKECEREVVCQGSMTSFSWITTTRADGSVWPAHLALQSTMLLTWRAHSPRVSRLQEQIGKIISRICRKSSVAPWNVLLRILMKHLNNLKQVEMVVFDPTSGCTGKLSAP